MTRIIPAKQSVFVEFMKIDKRTRNVNLCSTTFEAGDKSTCLPLEEELLEKSWNDKPQTEVSSETIFG